MIVHGRVTTMLGTDECAFDRPFSSAGSAEPVFAIESSVTSGAAERLVGRSHAGRRRLGVARVFG